MIITFAGHSSISTKEFTKEAIKKELMNLMNKNGAITCYLGGYGDFDNISALACKELRESDLPIEMFLITPYIDIEGNRKIKALLDSGIYDGSIYPPIENTPKKFAIAKRNEWMINEADIVIVYVNHDWGGAYKSLEFAKRRKKSIINVSGTIY